MNISLIYDHCYFNAINFTYRLPPRLGQIARRITLEDISVRNAVNDKFENKIDDAKEKALKAKADLEAALEMKAEDISDKFEKLADKAEEVSDKFEKIGEDLKSEIDQTVDKLKNLGKE